ncbi:preprotein translocase subunit SecG [Candidatus Woesebacteria bacterium]|nr:preprotein translocase subunit SecG [Candidatus Woesebacteria bacterium]
MQQILLVAQIILSVIITTVVLLQAQGAGLGSTWGGGGETYHTKRGLEKVLVYVTVIAIVLFTLSSIAALIL